MSAIVANSPLAPSNAYGQIEDRWYQQEAVDALISYFDTHGGNNADGTPKKANPLICMPTGTGKSLVIAKFIWRALNMFPGTRVFMSTHVKELIEQNAKKMLEVWPMAPLGIYSSGLKRRDFIQPIIFGGVQSCVGKFPLFGRRDLLVVDEAHLIGEEGRYLQFISELTNGVQSPGHNGGPPLDPEPGTFNPYLKVIGLSATPYRLGLGSMTNGSIFTDIAYNLCTIDGFTRLIAEGYLCPLIPKRTKTELDVSSVGKSAGDYNQKQLEAAVDNYETTYKALCEVVESGHDRACWLIFASGTDHADHIAEMLNTMFGVPTVAIHSKKTDAQNTQALEDWKTGKVRCAVNMNSLTTGVDNPVCDLIAMLRPTMSTGLWVQMLGRGTRPFNYFKLSDRDKERLAYFYGFIKPNCLVLDFAGNTRRLGPINDPVIPKKKGSGPPGDAPVRICPNCNHYNHATAKQCIVCGHVFPTSENIDAHASSLELLRSDLPQIEYFDVNRVVIVPHTSKAGNSTLKIAYYCGMRTYYEYQNIESKIPFVKKKARDWFRQRYHYNHTPGWWDGDVPMNNDDILKIVNELRPPLRIKVWVNKTTPEIMGYEF